TTYIDSVHCNASVVYRATVFWEGNPQTSPQFPDELYDEEDPKPETVILDSISYDQATDDLILGWEPSNHATFMNYQIIPEQDNGYPSENPIAIIENQNNPSAFITEDINPCDSQDKFLIITKSKCESSPNLFIEYFQAISVISNLAEDRCARTVTISFDEYHVSEGINQTIAKHEVWASEDGEPAEKLDEVSSPADSYTHEDINSGSTYEYFIRTFLEIDGEPVGTSTSCPKEVTTEEIPLPEEFRFENVTVLENQNIEISLYSTPEPELNGYRIYRTDENGAETVLTEISPSEDEEIILTDSAAYPENQSYTYRAEAIDLCDIEAMSADFPSTSIHLDVETSENTNILQWNLYEGWETLEQKVLRYHPDEDQPEEIAVIPSDQTRYEDVPVTQEIPDQGQYRYRIEAISNAGQISHSNFAVAVQETKVIMPNAFMPDGGVSYVFKPESRNLSSEDYQMLIFDRWGKQIFESNQPDNGWDGKINGEKAPQGNYIYLLRFRDEKNEIQTQKGNVLLIR
ncbi:MAG: gliding motility-associated C-terminal domain-containing protein, partial [Bacteroidota bacterium]